MGDERASVLQALRRRGASTIAVAAKFGVSVRTVQRWLRQGREANDLIAAVRRNDHAALDRVFARLPGSVVRAALIRAAIGATPTLRQRIRRVQADLDRHRRRGRPAGLFGIYPACEAQVRWIRRHLGHTLPPDGRWTWERIAERLGEHGCAIPARSLPRSCARLGLVFSPRFGVMQMEWWRSLPVAEILAVTESLDPDDGWDASAVCRQIRAITGRRLAIHQFEPVLVDWIRRLAAPGTGTAGMIARQVLHEYLQQLRDARRRRRGRPSRRPEAALRRLRDLVDGNART